MGGKSTTAPNKRRRGPKTSRVSINKALSHMSPKTMIALAVEDARSPRGLVTYAGTAPFSPPPIDTARPLGGRGPDGFRGPSQDPSGQHSGREDMTL